jgi:hypothetical protein
MTPTSVGDALTCVFIAINEVLPPAHQRVVGNILACAVDEKVVEGETRNLIERLLGRPKRPRTARRRRKVRA